ncbi:hypothetical protein OG272_15625 [Streptomyces sp. NBC_00104]|uniref:hypothetical protein n=1 Tax=Streptomyces sp. NBC_00104 TaxID=2903621 RepID=UPI00324EBE4E
MNFLEKPEGLRVALFTVGVVAFSLIAVCWPLITGEGNKSAEQVFGGVEFLLAGIVVMIGGVTDLVASDDVKRPGTRKMALMLSVFWAVICLGYSVRLAKYADSTPPAEYVVGTVLLVLCLMAYGSYSVWLATGR